MRTEQIIPAQIQAMLEQIKNVQNWWAEYPLEELPALPQFNRLLVVSGLNIPDLTEEGDKRVQLMLRLLYIDKETGKVFMDRRQEPWTVYADTWSYLRNAQNEPIEVISQTLDNEDTVIESWKDKLQVNSIDYLKTLIFSKQAHLIDLLSLYLADYAKANIEKLNKL